MVVDAAAVAPALAVVEVVASAVVEVVLVDGVVDGWVPVTSSSAFFTLASTVACCCSDR